MGMAAAMATVTRLMDTGTVTRLDTGTPRLTRTTMSMPRLTGTLTRRLTVMLQHLRTGAATAVTGMVDIGATAFPGLGTAFPGLGTADTGPDTSAPDTGEPSGTAADIQGGIAREGAEGEGLPPPAGFRCPPPLPPRWVIHATKGARPLPRAF